MRTQLLLLSLVAACHSEPAVAVEPVWDKQACAQCGALLQDPRPSSQALLSDDSRKFFDDVGCMADWLNRSGEKPRATWVQSPDGKRWVDALSVHYSGGHRTPMGYGFLSANEGLSFRELRIVAREKPQVVTPSHAAP